MSAVVNVFFSRLEMFNSLLLGSVSPDTFQVKFKKVSIKKISRASVAVVGEKSGFIKFQEFLWAKESGFII